jgi:hypothetical protein
VVILVVVVVVVAVVVPRWLESPLSLASMRKPQLIGRRLPPQQGSICLQIVVLVLAVPQAAAFALSTLLSAFLWQMPHPVALSEALVDIDSAQMKERSSRCVASLIFTMLNIKIKEPKKGWSTAHENI